MHKLSARLVAFAMLVFVCSVPNNVNFASNKGTHTSVSEAAKLIFEDHIRSIYDEAGLQNKDMDYSLFKMAVTGYYNLVRENKVNPQRQKLTVLDFRKPSNQKRFWVIDIASRRLLHYTFAAHGRNSGLVYAQHFSNEPSSLQSSLGFYKTDNTYRGQNGYSLYLDGLEAGFNDRARSRSIVMHGADYVTPEYIAQHGRAGRSYGCPAVPNSEHTVIIDNIKWGNCLFIYHDDLSYLNNSRLLNFQKAADYYALTNAY